MVEEQSVEDVRNVVDGTKRAWDARGAVPSESKVPASGLRRSCRDGAGNPKGGSLEPKGEGRAVARETLQETESAREDDLETKVLR